VSGQEFHTAGTYPGFCGIRQLGVFLLLHGRAASPLKDYLTPRIKRACRHLYPWVERGAVIVD